MNYEAAGMTRESGETENLAERSMFTTDFTFIRDAPSNPNQNHDAANQAFGKDWRNMIQNAGFLDPEELKMWEGIDL